jgi:predicted Rdx family selenoprotein
MAQELLMTFEDDAGLAAVTLIPSRAKPGGVFRISVMLQMNTLLRDRKERRLKMKELGDWHGSILDRFLGHVTRRKETGCDGPATVTNNGDADAAVAVDD